LGKRVYASRQMAAWEYKVLTLPASNYEVDEEILAIHGEKAWELVTIVIDSSNHRVCYLKRPANLEVPDVDQTVGMKAVKKG
jgi:hypothetical protein